MSVSNRANPPPRRRPVLATDRKAAAATSIELLGLDPGNHNNKSTNHAQENGDVCAGDEHRANSSGGFRELRASLVLDGSRDRVLVRGVLPNDLVSPRRSKRVVRKPVKPLWLAVVSVFVKNFVLLVVLLGFVQMVYRLAVRSGGGDVGVMELEGRLAEMDKALKKTAKMMQVQTETADTKLGNEIVGLREELSKRIEENSVGLENGLHKLDAKVDNWESALGRLGVDEFFTKEEFQKINKHLNIVGSVKKELSLDELRAYAREVVNREIERHVADGLGRVDYALASAGGKVVKHSEPFVVKKGSWLKMAVGGNVAHQDAETMLRPSFGEPGQCFPLEGSSGFVQVRLRTAIIPEAITLEHVAKSVAYDRSSAPNTCRVSGWLQGAEQVNTEKMFLLSEFTYDLDKSSAQTFPVSDSAGGGVVNMVRLDFTSNHGSPSHTCIYRLRVHGQEPESVSMMELH